MTLDKAINLMNTVHKDKSRIPLTSSKHSLAQDRYRNYFLFKGGI